MATIEEFEEKTTDLSKLIDLVEKDDLPTNIFTIEDTDPLVLLGKLNEIIAYLKDMLSLINSSDSKANEALTNALQALTTAREAIEGATLALNSSNTALSTANTALNTANTANEKANSANDVANEAMAEASEALMTAQEALSQVVSGLGTKVYDINNNLLSNAKFKGYNGINVDMSEEDSETFDIRLDNTITRTIELLNTRVNTNKTFIDNLTNTQATNTENIEQLQKGQADNDIAIVGLESKTLTHDEEIASLQSTTTENSQKLQRALFTPMSTPTSTKLVGVDTSNAQALIDAGENVEIENDKLNVRLKPDYESGWFTISKNSNYLFTHNLNTLNFITLIDIVYDNGTHYFYHQNTMTNSDGTNNSYAGGIDETSRTTTTLRLATAKNYAYCQSNAVNEVGSAYTDFATNDNVKAKVRLFKIGGNYTSWK